MSGPQAKSEGDEPEPPEPDFAIGEIPSVVSLPNSMAVSLTPQLNVRGMNPGEMAGPWDPISRCAATLAKACSPRARRGRNVSACW